MATHVSSTNKYVRLLVMTKQSKLNIYLNLPAKLMVCHTPFKSTREKMERGVVMMYQMVPVKVILQFTKWAAISCSKYNVQQWWRKQVTNDFFRFPEIWLIYINRLCRAEDMLTHVYGASEHPSVACKLCQYVGTSIYFQKKIIMYWHRVSDALKRSLKINCF